MDPQAEIDQIINAQIHGIIKQGPVAVEPGIKTALLLEPGGAVRVDIRKKIFQLSFWGFSFEVYRT